MIAMLLCGLWHGAAWTFVAWGGAHGAGLVVTRVWSKYTLNKNRTKSGLLNLADLGGTLLFVMGGWILFRSTDFQYSMTFVKQIIFFKSGTAWYHPFTVFIIVLTIALHLAKSRMTRIFEIIRLPEDAWYAPAILFCLIWLVLLFYPKTFQPFIYFQF